MNEMSVAEVKYVPHDVFDAYIESFNNRLRDEERLNDTRIERIEAIIEKALTVIRADNERLEEKQNKKLAEMQSEIKALNEKIDHNNELLNAKIDNMRVYFNEKIDHVTDTLTIAVNGTNDRLDDMKSYQNRWFTILTALGGVLTLVFAAFEFFK